MMRRRSLGSGALRGDQFAPGEARRLARPPRLRAWSANIVSGRAISSSVYMFRCMPGQARRSAPATSPRRLGSATSTWISGCAWANWSTVFADLLGRAGTAAHCGRRTRRRPARATDWKRSVWSCELFDQRGGGLGGQFRGRRLDHRQESSRCGAGKALSTASSRCRQGKSGEISLLTSVLMAKFLN